MGQRRKDPIQRILDRVEGDLQEDSCWNTTGHHDKDGYSKVWVHPTYKSSHRIMYEVFNGSPIPPGMVVRHKCDNPSCVNPNHLEIGTQKENQEDKSNRGNSTRGSKSHLSKLTEEQVREIKNRIENGERNMEIYKDYGVSRDLISKIRTGKLWGWLD